MVSLTVYRKQANSIQTFLSDSRECMCFSLGSLKSKSSLRLYIGNKQIRSELFYTRLKCMCISLGSLKSTSSLKVGCI